MVACILSFALFNGYWDAYFMWYVAMGMSYMLYFIWLCYVAYAMHMAWVIFKHVPFVLCKLWSFQCNAAYGYGIAISLSIFK